MSSNLTFIVTPVRTASANRVFFLTFKVPRGRAAIFCRIDTLLYAASAPLAPCFHKSKHFGAGFYHECIQGNNMSHQIDTVRF